MDVISKYKFTLAFENAISKDYVTEKLYDPLIAGSVPVYLGAPNVDEYLPSEKCIINVNSFKSIAELAEYLKYLDKNDAAYCEYLKWKQLPYKLEFIDKLETLKSHVYMRLCNAIKKKKEK